MAKDKDKGWIKLYRSLFEDDLWLKEPFTKGQAWVDLIGLANYGDTEQIYRGQPQVVKRGQLAVSEGFLASRWKWSRGRVRRYIDMLEFFKMVSVKRTSNGTTLTIENYDKYQAGRTSGGTSSGTSGDTTDGTADGTQKKNIKNEKEGKEIYSAFANVYLSGSEYQSLLSAYGEEQLSELIESLGEYKAASGREYKNDAAAIKTFARRQAQQKQQEEGSFEENYG